MNFPLLPAILAEKLPQRYPKTAKTVPVLSVPPTLSSPMPDGRLNADTVKRAANGRWRELLAAAGIRDSALDGRHGPCPKCGGKDRFRFTDMDGDGSVLCNQCPDGKTLGDGFASLQWWNGCSFPDAVRFVAGQLGVVESDPYPDVDLSVLLATLARRKESSKQPAAEPMSKTPKENPPPESRSESMPQRDDQYESLPDELTRVPGLIGELTDFSVASAPQPHRQLAFLGALALQSFLGGRKVVSADGFWSPLYLIALAQTGAGKEYPREVNAHVLYHGEQAVNLIDELASGEGLEDAIIEHRRLLFQNDEINFLFSNIGKARESRFSNLEAMILKLYSQVSSHHVGRTRAKARGEKTAPPAVVRNPALTLYGTSTPERLLDSLTPEMLEGGLIGRCFLVKCAPRGPGQRRIDPSKMPASIIELAEHWNSFTPSDGRKRGNLSDENPDPYVIPVTREAEQVFDRFRDDCEQQIRTNSVPAIAAIWTRAYELAGRLSVNYACSACPRIPEIDTPAARWACDTAAWGTHHKRVLVSLHLAETPHRKLELRVIRYLRGRGGSAPLRDVQRMLHQNKRDTEQVLETLLEWGGLEYQTAPTTTKQRVDLRLCGGCEGWDS